MVEFVHCVKSLGIFVVENRKKITNIGIDHVVNCLCLGIVRATVPPFFVNFWECWRGEFFAYDHKIL